MDSLTKDKQRQNKIEIDGVTKKYERDGEDPLHVLDNISCNIREGEIATFLGPSGCGKTTMLKMVDGLIEPTSGEIRVDSRPVDGSSPDRALVFQTFQLFPWRTVKKNISLGLEIQDVDQATIDETREKWIDTVGLDGFQNSYPDELSGGMKQRVGLARALAVNPNTLLMDEPFGSLDAQTKEELQIEFLRLIEDEKKTVVFVTHDIREAVFLSDHVHVFSTKPASITKSLEIDFERPRWDRRTEVEEDGRYARYVSELRQELGLRS